jgi:hypothetical protein
MIARHLLDPDDFEWFLDHGCRRYRLVSLDLDDEGRAHQLRIIPVSGAKPTTVMARCGLFPDEWDDTDRYASARLNAISTNGGSRAGVIRPDPDGVRLGHDFGQWCAELFRGDRLAQRIPCDSWAEAYEEVTRLAGQGLRVLPDAPSVILHRREA